MPRIPNWTRESRTPSLTYRNTESRARAVLHRAPNSYTDKWRAAILVDGYPIWSRGFERKGADTLPTNSETVRTPAYYVLIV